MPRQIPLTKSQIRVAIDDPQGARYELDRLVVLAFFPFYSTPPPFSSDSEAALLLVEHFTAELDTRIRSGSEQPQAWVAACGGPDGSVLKTSGESEALAITRLALWYAACHLCENDES